MIYLFYFFKKISVIFEEPAVKQGKDMFTSIKKWCSHYIVCPSEGSGDQYKSLSIHNFKKPNWIF